MRSGFVEKAIIRKIKSSTNKSVIELCINDEKELFNRFSVEKNNFGSGRINNDIIEYLFNEVENFPLKNSVEIHVRMPVLFKREFIEKLIKDNIGEQILKINKKLFRKDRSSIVLAVFGMLLIAFTQVFQFLASRYSFKELIIVMSWVFMWKAVELFFFERVAILKEKRILLKLYYAHIVLEKP